jgi:hypothetical protein
MLVGSGGLVCTPKLESLTILRSAVLVDVITTEKHTRLIAVDESVVPASRLSSRGIAEVLPVIRGRISMSEDMIFGVGSKDLGLGDSLTKNCSLCGVARLVNLVLGHGSSCPIVSAGRLSERAAVVIERAMRVLRVSRGWIALRSCDS